MVSSVLAQAILSQKAPRIVDSFREGQEISRQGRVRELSGEALKGSEGALEELSGIDPEIALSLGEAIRAKSAKDINDYIRDAKIGLNQLNSGDVQGAKSFAFQRRDSIRQRGGDTTQTDEFIALLESGDVESARQSLQGFVGAIDQAKDSAATQDFKFKTEGLSEEDAIKAKRISLGLDPRAGISAQERIAGDLSTTQQVAASQAAIKGASAGASERAKLGAQVDLKPQVEAAVTSAKGQAALSTKIVEKSFESIGKARRNISNMDRAIAEIDKGAKTGAIQRFLPSIRAASIELDQIRGELGLDVIGAVTFGALSESELDFALDTALPDKLKGPELRDFLVRKKEAQAKTIANLNEAVQFLSQPNATVADFIESKQSAGDAAQAPQAAQKTISVDF